MSVRRSVGLRLALAITSLLFPVSALAQTPPGDERHADQGGQRESRHGFRLFGDVGTPPNCRPTDGETDRGSLPDKWPTLRSRLEACANDLNRQQDPYMNRRTVYSGVSTTSTFAAVIGGARAAVSTTNAWV